MSGPFSSSSASSFAESAPVERVSQTGSAASHDSALHHLFSEAYNVGANVVETAREHPLETTAVLAGVAAAIWLSKGRDTDDAIKGGEGFFSKFGGDPVVMLRQNDGRIVQRTLSSLKNDGFFQQDPWWKDLWEQVKEGVRRLTRRP